MPRPTEIAGQAMGKIKGLRQALTGGAGVFERLSTEHGELSTLIRRVAATADSSAIRSELYPRIRQQLLAHVRAEEKEVYSVFRNLPGLETRMDKSADEHHRIEAYFTQLDSIPTTEHRWIEVFREMMALVHEHLTDEEQQIFSKAKKSLTKERSKELEEKYLASKSRELDALV